MTRTITDPSELDVLHAEHHALSGAMHALPPANAVRVCQCRADDERPADGDSPEAEAAANGAAVSDCTHEIVEWGNCAGCGQSIEREYDDLDLYKARLARLPVGCAGRGWYHDGSEIEDALRAGRAPRPCPACGLRP